MISSKNDFAAHSNYVILRSAVMNDSIVRYQFNPTLTDTIGFFDYCIPLTNESVHPTADSLLKYYDYTIYNYITPFPAPKQFLQTTSIFRPHNLPLIHKEPLEINRQATDFITVVFLTCLFILAWIQTSYSKRLIQIFRAVAQPHHVNQLEREGNLFKERISLGLGIIYFMISSVFIFLIVQEFNAVPTGLSNLVFTGIIFAGLLAYELSKSSLVYVSGIIFDTRETSRQYQLNILIFNFAIGVVLLPFVLIAFYWSSLVLLTSGIIIVLLLSAYRLIRGFLTGLENKNYNLFYLFLYLCTLEILPLLLFYKVISKM
ncbi:MAG: DUF4271 domain-containing protein [Lentimicrobiaceae bacterium]|jgi:hypothetical protein